MNTSPMYCLVLIIALALLASCQSPQTVPADELDTVQKTTSEPSERTQETERQDAQLLDILEAFASHEIDAAELVAHSQGLAKVTVVEDATEDANPNGLAESATMLCGDEAIAAAEGLRATLAARLEDARKSAAFAPSCDESQNYCWFPSPHEFGAGLRVEFAQRPRLKAILFYAADATLTPEFIDTVETRAFDLRDQLFAENACRTGSQ
ncbi:hypothetical protein FRC96_15400 [Lujinxingia vulgaris]|uniref:Uncharacterized protein n=1 Tax=Lujinxingia vulgaris TaxID=2600176 RepID=A0A5C6X9E4_9DELT|nr:hypothetical protein [Lujinxingia vulgaris]TXD33849.1 hypothetical protein FRC96_15400 [Lujinxingia vulgaris]